MFKYAAAIWLGVALISLSATGPALALKKCTLSNGTTKLCTSCKASKCFDWRSARRPNAKTKTQPMMRADVSPLQYSAPIGEPALLALASGERFVGKPMKTALPADVSPLQYWSPVNGHIATLLETPHACASAEVMRVFSGLKINLECWQISTGNPENATKWGSTRVWGMTRVWGQSHGWGNTQTWGNNRGWGKTTRW